MSKKVVILDFGSQYTQLIARRVRELNVFCVIYPYHREFDLEEVQAVILSGSPASVNDDDAPQVDLSKLIGRVPVMGLCYGAQLFAKQYGGVVEASTHREYGKAELSELSSSRLLHGVSKGAQVWMSHGDTILRLPEKTHIIAGTDTVRVGAFRYDTPAYKSFYGLQFHPEVTHTVDGKQILHNFLFEIANCEANWSAESYIHETVDGLRKKIGDDHVLMGLSGGVDSTVAATLLHRAIGDRLTCLFVDNGLLRKNEFEEVIESYRHLGLNVKGVDEKASFYRELQGVAEPEKKRKVIGRVFIEVFEEHAKRLKQVRWLGQGTIYPDVIESVSVHGPSVTIKSHHNVGGLPERLALNIVEPLRMLFKDEVRRVGRALEIPSFIIDRHPFPGPGLGIRILGDITPEKVALLQEADHIFINELKKDNLYNHVWQAATILLPVQSVGVMGDGRTYEKVVALRAVNSSDGMTADWTQLPPSFLAKVSSKIINSVKGINRVVYDISTKPPATIEWE